jgi:hypothetical protein
MANNNGLQDEELPLEDELETIQDDVVEETPEEDVEEVEEEPAYQEPQEERVPKSRLDALAAERDTLRHALETLAQRQQPQVAPQPTAPVRDQYEGYTPERKQWAEFIKQEAAGEIDRRVEARLEQITRQAIEPLRRNSIEVQERIDEQDTMRQFKDYSQYKDKINQVRAEWYQRYNVVAPRDVAYHYVKGQMAGNVATTSRTQAVRANAKQGSSVPNKPPAKKSAPKGPVTLNDVANMSAEDAERWLLTNNAKF